MSTYAWIPVKDDCYDPQMASFCMSRHVSCIPRNRDQREPYASSYSRFSSLADGDTLIIQAHGLKKSTKQIGWKTGKSVTLWTAEQLAMMLGTHMSAQQKAYNIDYDLMVCWGGDNILGWQSFGARLASAMGEKGFRGQVIAYKGMVVIGGYLSDTVVQGQGRIRSWFGDDKVGTSELNTAMKSKNNGKEYIDKRNYYHGTDACKKYGIPRNT